VPNEDGGVEKHSGGVKLRSMHNGDAASHSAPSLRRVLGMTEVTAGGVGIIIGAGIYVLLGLSGDDRPGRATR
jgi:hypothetical protein